MLPKRRMVRLNEGINVSGWENIMSFYFFEVRKPFKSICWPVPKRAILILCFRGLRKDCSTKGKGNDEKCGERERADGGPF